MPIVNKVLLVGTIGQYGVEMRYANSGTACASFTLVLEEDGSDGKLHQIYITCEVWGKKAEAASELEAGMLCLFEGKLARRRKGEQWEWVVSGFHVQPIGAQKEVAHV